MDERKAAANTVLATCLSSFFETTINLKQNNLNFGSTIYLKSRAERQGTNRYLDKTRAIKEHYFWFRNSRARNFAFIRMSSQNKLISPE